MAAFYSVLSNVGVMLAYMLIGFVMTKTGKCSTPHARSISGLLIYICGFCLQFSSYQAMERTAENVRRMGLFFLVSLAVQLLAFGILYLILHRRYADARLRILSAGSVLGNVGYFGLPLVVGLFPDQPIVACYATMYMLSMNILIFTLGEYMVSGEKRYVSVKAAILNPTVIAALIAIPLFLLQVKVPSVVRSSTDLLGKMTAPLCMFVLGMRLASMRFREVFGEPLAYGVCVLKLVVFPLFALGLAYLIPGLDAPFRTCLFVLSGAPTAAVVLALAEQHEMERRLSANTLLLTTVLSVVTLPVMVLLFT